MGAKPGTLFGADLAVAVTGIAGTDQGECRPIERMSGRRIVEQLELRLPEGRLTRSSLPVAMAWRTLV